MSPSDRPAAFSPCRSVTLAKGTHTHTHTSFIPSKTAVYFGSCAVPEESREGILGAGYKPRVKMTSLLQDTVGPSPLIRHMPASDPFMSILHALFHARDGIGGFRRMAYRHST